jgi:undecaprenyl-diphosphatase
MEKLFNKKNTIIFVALVVLWKLFLSAALQLHPDEAYYWLWSKRLDLGYFDHSPMVAYFIKLTTFFSDSELAVRFSSIIALLILSVLMWNFTKKMFGQTAAAASVIVVNSMPITLVGAIVITPDTPAFLFFSCAVYFLWRLIETNETKFWYLTGLFFGLALLSKYTAVLFGLCVIVYMILDKKLFWFKNKHFYLMFVLSFVIFLPVIIWNSAHDWISFSFQLSHGLSSSKIYFNYVLEYLGAQCLVVGPFIFIAGISAAFSYFFSKESKKIFLASFCMPVIIFFMLTALKRYPGANWPSLAYFSFAIMTAQYLVCGGVIKRKILIIGIAFNVIVSVLLGLHAKYSIFPIYKISASAAIADATNWFSGWREFGEELNKREIKYAATKQHQWSAAIEYYTNMKVISYVSADRKNQYEFWWKEPEDFNESKKVLVLVDYEMEDDFTKIGEPVEIITLERNGIPIRQYAIIKL